VPFFHPVATDAIEAVKAWIDEGAKNNGVFETDILPMFANAEAFGGDVPCTECHQSFRDPPSFNEVNLTSYEAIMKGAFSKTRAKDGMPIVVPFESEQSPLYTRLTRNRMPPGLDPGEEGNHPNILMLGRWIEQGAWCR